MAGDGDAALERAGGRSFDRASLRERTDVFVDRAEAGRVLAELLTEAAVAPARVLAIPAGGVPVAAAMARQLGWPLDVAVVSKITLPWNTEAGYGAVAFDGTVLLNEALVRECGLTERQVEQGVAATRYKVERRVERLRKGRVRCGCRARRWCWSTTAWPPGLRCAPRSRPAEARAPCA